MNLGLYKRENLRGKDPGLIGDAVIDQFQRTHGAITAWQEVEHTDDGHHTDIHATSVTIDPGGLTVKGDIASGDGGFTGEDGNVAIGDLPNAGTPLQSGGYGIKLGPWRIISDPNNSPSTPGFPGLIFQFLNETVGNFLFRFIRLGTYDWAFAPQTGVQVALGWGTNRLSNVITAALSCIGMANIGSITTGDILANNVTASGNLQGANAFVNPGGYYELGRSFAQGYWQPVPYSAANFQGSGAATWTVGAGAVTTNKISLVGKTLFWSCIISASQLTGGATNVLRVTVPLGLSVKSFSFAVAKGFNTGGLTLAMEGSGTLLDIRRMDAANFVVPDSAFYVYINFSAEVL